MPLGAECHDDGLARVEVIFIASRMIALRHVETQMLGGSRAAAQGMQEGSAYGLLASPLRLQRAVKVHCGRLDRQSKRAGYAFFNWDRSNHSPYPRQRSAALRFTGWSERRVCNQTPCLRLKHLTFAQVDWQTLGGTFAPDESSSEWGFSCTRGTLRYTRELSSVEGMKCFQLPEV